jgi:hypothetical protein
MNFKKQYIFSKDNLENTRKQKEEEKHHSNSTCYKKQW